MLNILTRSLQYKLYNKRTPLVLSMGITSRCNLKCSYCYSQHDNMKGHDVRLDTVTSRIDAFYNLGTRVVLLQGGEPLLHRNIAQIIRYVKGKGMYCSITTNGVNVEKLIDPLKAVDQVQLSIDGNEEITDRFRGKGVYQKVVNAARLCHENQIPFHLHLVLTREATVENTLLPLTEIVDKYESYLNFCIPAETGAASNKILIHDRHIQEFYRAILQMKKHGMRTNNSSKAITSIIEWGNTHPYSGFISRSDEKAENFPKCVMGDLVCWLDSNGMLHPCAIKYGESGFSYSVDEHGVEGAWKKLCDVPCRYCVFSTEFNCLFKLRAESVLNSLKFLKSRRKS